MAEKKKLAIIHNCEGHEREIKIIEFVPNKHELILLKNYKKKGIYRNDHYREGTSEYVVASYFSTKYKQFKFENLPRSDLIDDTDPDIHIPVQEKCNCTSCEWLIKNYIGYRREDFDFIIFTDMINDYGMEFGYKVPELIEFMKEYSHLCSPNTQKQVSILTYEGLNEKEH